MDENTSAQNMYVVTMHLPHQKQAASQRYLGQK